MQNAVLVRGQVDEAGEKFGILSMRIPTTVVGSHCWRSLVYIHFRLRCLNLLLIAVAFLELLDLQSLSEDRARFVPRGPESLPRIDVRSAQLHAFVVDVGHGLLTLQPNS